LGAGTIQTFTLSASLFGVADPLTPGLTPANVTFTQGNTDTGSVTVVPSGTQPGNGTFSFDATGGVIGSVNLTANIDTFASNTVSLNVIAPALYSPVNGSTLPGSAVTFYWTEYPGATAYWLDVGATPGGNTYAQSGSLSSSTLSYTVNTLPTDGSTVYATWYSLVNGSWRHSDYSYTAYTAGSSKGVITSPVPGSTLTGSTVNFIWTLGNGATNYWIDAGSTVGGNQYFQSGPLGNVNTKTVTGLPTDGSTVYVTLYSLVGGTWLNNQYTYTAYSVVVGPPPVSFLTAVNYGAGSGPDSVAAGDFNGDGKADLAVANYGDGTVSVLLGNGDGTFQSAVNYPVGSAAALVVVADLNGDGKLDLAVADANGVSVLLGNGDGTFQPAVNYPAGTNPFWVAVADLNGDGKLDLAVADGGGGVSVLLGNGDGTFQAAVNYGAGASPYSVAVGDFNGDGKPDLTVANYGDGTVSVLLNNGNGTFQTAVNYSVGSSPYAVAVGDFNGDGKLDLATANYASGNVSVLIGNGNGTFQPAVNYAAGPGANSVSVADFNGDGKLDLAVADRNSNNVSVLLGNGDGTFQPPANYGVGAGPAGSVAGDFNGDGKPDIATANYGANSVSILLSNTAFQGPAIVYSPAPNSTLPGPSVTFQWTPSDSATAYWIDVGSSAGGNQYYQSGSLLTTTLSATVNGLPLNGSAVYATMYSLIGGQWVHNSYTYTAFTGSSKGVITTPANGSTFTGTTVTFGWTAGAGASAYWLDAGSTPFGNNYYQSGNLGNVLTTTVSGLPSDGSTVYVTLYSYVGGQWLSNSYTYTAFTPIVTLGVMQTPIPGSTLSGNTATFTWSAGVGATAYWLEVGSSPGGNQYYQSGNLGNVLTTTMYTLPQNGSTVYATLYSYIGGQWLSNSYTYGSAMAFQGFETDIGDWQPITTRVASGGGVLGVSSASGSYHAELTNVYDTYGTGYGGAEYSLFGYATQPPYPGDFSQSISMYIDKNWPTASPNGNGVGVWIDMSPGNPDPNNYGAEHNFRFTPSGTAVAVSVDGQGSPIATITTSGWYKFQMTYQKGALPTDLVITNMNVFDSTGHLVGTTTVLANSPGGPLLSENLLGPGYVWITVWADGWPAAGANDVLAIDDVRTDLL